MSEIVDRDETKRGMGKKQSNFYFKKIGENTKQKLLRVYQKMRSFLFITRLMA